MATYMYQCLAKRGYKNMSVLKRNYRLNEFAFTGPQSMHAEGVEILAMFSNQNRKMTNYLTRIFPYILIYSIYVDWATGFPSVNYFIEARKLLLGQINSQFYAIGVNPPSEARRENFGFSRYKRLEFSIKKPPSRARREN